MKNYYEILEVNQKASKEVIDKAYKVLIKKYHPDLYEGEKKQYAEKKTKEINEAYRILSSDFLKEQYDDELEVQRRKEIQNNYRIRMQKQTQEQVQFQKNKTEQEETEKAKKNKIGTLESIVELTKNLINLIKNEEKREEIKEVTRKDVMALVLTIIVVIIIGIILWFIPFTNNWMRGLLFENPLFNWIGSMLK